MIVAGTGHRPEKVGGHSVEAFAHLCWVAKIGLRELRPSRVISGMAMGWDQALAVSAIQMGIPVDAYVPFAGQESRWTGLSQMKYESILSGCDSVVTVSPGGYSREKMQIRNEAMVDACDTVLALWDGSGGGTGNCIRYCEATNTPYRNMWDIYSFVI